MALDHSQKAGLLEALRSLVSIVACLLLYCVVRPWEVASQGLAILGSPRMDGPVSTRAKEPHP